MNDDELIFPYIDRDYIPTHSLRVISNMLERKCASLILNSILMESPKYDKVHLKINPEGLFKDEVINRWTESHMPNFSQRALDKIQDNHKLLEDFSVDIIGTVFASDDLQNLMSCSQFSTREYLPVKGELTMEDHKLIIWPMSLKNIIGLMIDANSTISLWYISEKAYNTKVRLWRGVAWALPNMYKDLNVLNIIGVQPEEIYYGSDINLMVDADDYTPKEVDSEC